MAINERGSGLAYLTDKDNISIYHLKLRNTLVLEVGVDNKDPELKIMFRKPGESTWSITQGRAIREEGNPTANIDGLSIQSYVYPRAPEILFDFWIVPQLTADVQIPDTLPEDFA